MEFNPEEFRKLLETFRMEMDECLQTMTDGLLQLEKNNLTEGDFKTAVEKIFRAAHTLKGAARGLGIKPVGDIAHHLESLFSAIQKKEIAISSNLIDLGLEAIDNLRSAMQSYIDKKPLSFDIDNLLERLEKGDTLKNPQEKKIVKQTVTHPEDETIRVAIENLDRVSAISEEIQINKIAIDDHYLELTHLVTTTKEFTTLWKQTWVALKNQLGKSFGDYFQKLYHSCGDCLVDMNQKTEELHKEMRTRINELTLLSNSLQEEVRLLRLVPITSLLQMMPRIVRDIAHELKKEVELTITGDEIKMDKQVLEELKDPLIHLLRNAIDHGIEPAAIRQAQGKSAVGHIHIQITEEGGQIIFDISDDGAGIDVQQITQIAKNKNLVAKSELENMNENDILNLIFRSGFSSKDMITDVSGRGVGLDIVKSNVDSLKGQVSVKTEINKGTTFHIRVPLTLTSERGLMIKSGGEIWMIPTSGVERVLVMQSQDIVEIEASEAIMLDKHPVPFRTLSDVLSLPQKTLMNEDSLPIVIIKKGWQMIALLVEEIIGEREMVIKPLRAPLQNIACVIGGTLAGNGRVLIVLNPHDLITRAVHAKKAIRAKQEDMTISKKSRPRILVVDDSITTRTLEKNILESRDYEVVVAANGKEAWDLLQEEKFSLLITDVMMPVMDGFTLTENVKKSEKHRDLPVIIVTSLGSDAEKKRGIEVGANAYVVKNEFESGALLEIVSQLV